MFHFPKFQFDLFQFFFLLNYMSLTSIVLFHPFFCVLFNSFRVYPYPLTPLKSLIITLNYFTGISSTPPILESIAMILSFEDLYWFHFSYFFCFFSEFWNNLPLDDLSISHSFTWNTFTSQYTLLSNIFFR